MELKKLFLVAATCVVALSVQAGNYTVSGTTGSFGTVTIPSTFSGHVTSAVGSSGGVWNTFTFTPKSGGTQTVTVSPTLRFGSKHTVRTQIYRGTVSLIATFDGAGSKSISLTGGQYYTIKVQMISPSYYTTTVYDYVISIGGGAGGGSGSGSGSSSDIKLNPPTPSASQGQYSYIKVSWSTVSGSKGYVIKRGTSSNYSQATQLKKITKASTKSFNDTSAKKGTIYYYWVCPLATSTTYWYNASRYAQGYVKGTSSGGSSSGAYISGSTKVTYKANSTTSAYYLYVGGKKITSGVTWTKSGSGVTLSKSGGGAKLKMTTRPSGSYNVIYLNAKYKNTNYKKSVYIYR